MITTSDISAIVQADHQTLLNDYSWAARKADQLITTSAINTTGTVTTSGTTVTGSGTSFTSAMVGMWIRIGSNTFFDKITAFGSATSLTIEAALPTDVSSASGFTIFQHVYSLSSDFGRLTSLTSDVRLTEWSRSEIDRIDPYRTSTGTKPSVYSLRGLDSSNNFQIEFWPVPKSANTIRLEYLKQNSLSSDSDIPLYRSDILMWKSAESASYFLHAKTGDQSWLALADRYHARYLEALEGGREDDMGKYSAASYVRDKALVGFGRGDDFWIEHDWLVTRT